MGERCCSSVFLAIFSQRLMLPNGNGRRTLPATYWFKIVCWSPSKHRTASAQCTSCIPNVPTVAHPDVSKIWPVLLSINTEPTVAIPAVWKTSNKQLEWKAKVCKCLFFVECRHILDQYLEEGIFLGIYSFQFFVDTNLDAQLARAAACEPSENPSEVEPFNLPAKKVCATEKQWLLWYNSKVVRNFGGLMLRY